MIHSAHGSDPAAQDRDLQHCIGETPVHCVHANRSTIVMDTLVILGSSLTALAVARDAHAHGLTAIVVGRTAGIAFKSRRGKPVSVAQSKPDEVLATVTRYGGAGSALVATGDDWLRFVAANRAALDAAFGQVLHPANSVVETFLSKSKFSDWCGRNGLPTPRTWHPGSTPRPEGLKFPVLIRPNETLHARTDLGLPKAVEVHSEAELRDWIERFERHGVCAFVSESLLSERLTQYSVPFARRSDAATLSFVARKLRPEPRECSQGSFVTSTSDAEVEQLGRLAAERAEYYGIGEVEILHAHDSGRNYIIEINARPWLQYALAPATGNDFLGLMLRTASADAPKAHQGRKTWINLRNDRAVAFCESTGSVRQRRLTLGAYLRSLASSNVYAVLDVRDPMPFLDMVSGSFRRVSSRLMPSIARRTGTRAGPAL